MPNTIDARPRPLDEFLVYLTGPAEDAERLEAADRLRGRGATVWGPTAGDTERDLDEVVSANLDAVFACDVVALLPGWERDGRVAVVKMLAEAKGVPVVRFADLVTLG